MRAQISAKADHASQQLSCIGISPITRFPILAFATEIHGL